MYETYPFPARRLPTGGKTLQLRCSFDGSSRKGHAGAGCAVNIRLQDGGWHLWHCASVYLGKLSSTAAELIAAATLIDFLHTLAACQTQCELLTTTFENTGGRSQMAQ